MNAPTSLRWTEGRTQSRKINGFKEALDSKRLHDSQAWNDRRTTGHIWDFGLGLVLLLFVSDGKFAPARLVTWVARIMLGGAFVNVAAPLQARSHSNQAVAS